MDNGRGKEKSGAEASPKQNGVKLLSKRKERKEKNLCAFWSTKLYHLPRE
jgi:hypothetical protein